MRIEFGPSKASKPARAKPEGAEPGDAPAPAAASPSAESALAMRGLLCERAVQNCRKNAEETLGAAEAFDAIRLELDQQSDRHRRAKGTTCLGHRRAAASHWRRHVSGTRKNASFSSARALATARSVRGTGDFAREQVDAILVAMNQVLSRMIELEDFNEAVKLLREIIDSQRQLGEQARKRQKDALRDLLEDKP